MTTSGRALSIAASTRDAAAIPLGRVLHRERVRPGDGSDLAGVDDDAQQIDRFLEIGVAQIKRPDDFFVLAAFRRCVGNDRDRARRGHAIEVAGRRETDVSASPSVTLRKSIEIVASRAGRRRD